MEQIENMNYEHFLYCIANDVLPEVKRIIHNSPIPRMIRSFGCTLTNIDTKMYSFYLNRHYLEYYTIPECLNRFLIPNSYNDISSIVSEVLSRVKSENHTYTENTFEKTLNNTKCNLTPLQNNPIIYYHLYPKKPHDFNYNTSSTKAVVN